MNIMHLSLDGTYTEGFSYQENLLPRYQSYMGHHVVMVAENRAYDYTGRICEIPVGKYVDEYGVEVYRLKLINIINHYISRLLCAFRIYDILIKEKPDLIFVHDIGKVSTAYYDIKRYIRKVNPKCYVFGDIHNDFYNTIILPRKERSFFDNIFIGIRRWFFRNLNFKMCSIIYAITPSCMQMARKFYNVPKSKLKFLPLGYDSNLKQSINREEVRSEIRTRNHISEDDIVIVHGGKLDEAKKTVELIDAIAALNDNRIKLILYGGVSDNYKSIINDRIEMYSKWLTYLGPLNQKEYYDVFLASDLAVFPGGQSSMWQEAIGCDLPIIVYRRDGMTDYLNRCGNADFIESQDTKEIYKKLLELTTDKKYKQLQIAAAKASAVFSYRRIAEKVIKDYDYIERKDDENTKNWRYRNRPHGKKSC